MQSNKKLMTAAVLLTAIASIANAQEMFDGLVTKIDASAQKITIKHGPLKKFDMDDPMTMVFRAQEPAMLKTVKVGDKIKFDAEKIKGQFTLTKIEKTK